MNYTYAERKKAVPAKRPPERIPQNTSAHIPSAFHADMHPVDLPGAIRAKMESSFGADLSAVRLYESQAVADAGANAVAQGSRIAFAPGALDFASTSGQALLGHELSHVVSQARGEVTGSGFLSDQALEARADREGALAAAGQQVYTGPVTASLSPVSAASAAGPMQASKASEKATKHMNKSAQYLQQIAGSSTKDAKTLMKKAAKEHKWMNYWANKITDRAEADTLFSAKGTAFSPAASLPILEKTNAPDRIVRELLTAQQQTFAKAASGEAAYHIKDLQEVVRNGNTVYVDPHGSSNGGSLTLTSFNKKGLDLHDQMTGNQMTVADKEKVQAKVDMQAVFNQLKPVSDRYQTPFENVNRSYRKEVDMDSENYNAGRLFDHLGLSINLAGDSNTSAFDRMEQYQTALTQMADGSPEQQEQLMKNIKGGYRAYLQRMEDTYGTDIENLSFSEIADQNTYAKMSSDFKDASFPITFALQYGTLFDPNNDDDQKFLQLARYFHSAYTMLNKRVGTHTGAKDRMRRFSDNKNYEIDHSAMLQDSKAKLAEIEARRRNRG